jgi:hypothetical protein
MVDRAELTYHFLINFSNLTLLSKDSIRPQSARITAVLPTRPGTPNYILYFYLFNGNNFKFKALISDLIILSRCRTLFLIEKAFNIQKQCIIYLSIYK